MKKKRIIIFIVIVLVVLLLFFFSFKNKSSKDALKFKEEYEKYNNVDTEDGYTYPTVTVEKTDPIYYATSEEIVDVLKHKTGVIYFGTPKDPWCRNAINVLLDAARSTKIDRIYYMDLSKKQDVYEAKNKKAYKTKEGTKEYYTLVDLLKEYLSNYLVNDGKNIVDTNVKRIFMPTVVFVKEGKILSVREGTTQSHLNNGNGYLSLQAGEVSQLYNYYVDKFNMTFDLGL